MHGAPRAPSAARCPRGSTTSRPLALPGDTAYDVVKRGSGKQEVATTMAFVRLLKDLMQGPGDRHRFVPIIPDEARTFGMDALFPTLKIYNPHGPDTTLSVDRELMLSYKEATDGQILHEGINEAGSVASFTAVGTSYSTHGEPMIPVYIFYSMFGFQRTGDAFWAAADQMARGFVHRRHRRPHHAERRGPAARGRPLATLLAVDQPGGGGLRPGVRLRDRAHRAGRAAPDVRRGLRERLLLPHRLQRAHTCSRPSPRTSTSTASCAACTCSPPATAEHAPAGPAAGLRRRRCRGR